jgi:hypothetical protein
VSGDGRFDVFPSYARNDGLAAAEVNSWLRNNGLRTFFDQSELHGAERSARRLALLVASLIAGILWEQIGPAGTFIAGAAACAPATTSPWLRLRFGKCRT